MPLMTILNEKKNNKKKTRDYEVWGFNLYCETLLSVKAYSLSSDSVIFPSKVNLRHTYEIRILSHFYIALFTKIFISQFGFAKYRENLLLRIKTVLQYD